MNNNNIAAVEIEAARNLKIYNALADIAREVFNHLNAEEGRQYTAADIARAITGGPVVTCVNGLNYRCDRIEKYAIGNGLQFAEDYSPETVYSVEIDNFSCRVNGWKIFDVLERAARAWNIATAARVIFEKKRAAAPVVVSFTLSAAAARELAACCAKDILRPVMNGVHLDTRRRCLVASDGRIMRVLHLGAALAVDESAAASSYIIPADVLKSGRVVTIDANDIASTDKKSAPVIPGRYPNYFSVIPAASEAGRVAITPAQWKEIKKAVADVAKVHPSGKYSQRRVIMSHESYSDKLTIYAFNYDFNVERETAVNIDATAPAFSLSFDADQFLKIGGTPTAFYLKDNSRAIVTTDAAGLSLCMPMLQTDSDKYYYCFSFADGAADLLPGVDIAAAAAELKEEHEHAAALEIVAMVREECKGKSTAKMLKYIDDNFGWSAALQRARTMLKEEIEREQNAAAVAIETSETPAALVPDVAAPVEITTTANDTTANDDSERETPARRRGLKSLDDIAAQLERIKSLISDVVLMREGHSDGRTKEDRRLYSRLQLAQKIHNLYFRRMSFYFARLKMRHHRAALVPAAIYAAPVPNMRVETDSVIYDFICDMEPGPWEASANTFAELLEGLNYDDTRELCRAEILRRANDGAHKYTEKYGFSNHAATANELVKIFMARVDAFAAARPAAFACVDDFLNNMVPQAEGPQAPAPADIQTPANDDTQTGDTPAPADVADIETAAAIVAALVPVAFVDVCETPANDGTTPGHGAAPVDTSEPLQIWHPATAAPADVRDIERETPANDDTRAALVYLAGRARRLALTVAAAVAAVFLLILSPENETPATAAPVIETAPAVLVPDVANDDTAAPAADIETSANDTTAAAPVYSPATAANVAAPVETPPTMEKRATAKKRQPRAAVLVPVDTTANDSARALRVDTLEAAGEITAPAAADIDTSTTANDDSHAPVVISTDESDSDTAAPSSDDTANDDTQTDGTTAPTSGTTATASTPTPAAVPLSPAVLAFIIASF